MDNQYKEKSNVGGFKENVSTRSNSPKYFSRENNRYFGSKVSGVRSRNNNNEFIAKESVTNPYDKKTDYKILAYDNNKREFYASKLYESKSERDEVYNKVKKGEMEKENLEKRN